MVAKTLNRHFVKFCKEHGITIEQGGKHVILRKNDKVVGSMSSTGGDGRYEMFAMQQLVRNGAVPRKKAKYRFG